MKKKEIVKQAVGYLTATDIEKQNEKLRRLESSKHFNKVQKEEMNTFAEAICKQIVNNLKNKGE